MDALISMVKKAIIAIFSTVLIVVVANQLLVPNIHTNSFMANESIVFFSDIENAQLRKISAFSPEAFSKNTEENFLKLSIEKDAKKVNGHWEITRMLGSDGGPIYDIENGFVGSTRPDNIKIELMQNSVVKVTSSEDVQFYNVSNLYRDGRIELHKKHGEGYERITAQRVIKKVTARKVELASDSNVLRDKGTEFVSGLALNEENDNGLRLRQVSDPENSKKVLGISFVTGEAKIERNRIVISGAKLEHANAYSHEIDFEADLADGDVFLTQMEDENGETVDVSGSVSNSPNPGGDIFVRFATGPLKGSTFHFVSENKWEAEKNNLEDKQIMAEEAMGDNIERVAEKEEELNDADNLEITEVSGNREVAYYQDEEYFDEYLPDEDRDFGPGDDSYYEDDYDEKLKADNKDNEREEVPLGDDEVAAITLEKGFQFI